MGFLELRLIFRYSLQKYGLRYPESISIPFVRWSVVLKFFGRLYSKQLHLNQLPILPLQLVPSSWSPFAEMVATLTDSSYVEILFVRPSRIFIESCNAASIPFLISSGEIPVEIFLIFSSRSTKPNTVAVVVPSPATSFVQPCNFFDNRCSN